MQMLVLSHRPTEGVSCLFHQPVWGNLPRSGTREDQGESHEAEIEMGLIGQGAPEDTKLFRGRGNGRAQKHPGPDMHRA